MDDDGYAAHEYDMMGIDDDNDDNNNNDKDMPRSSVSD